MVDDGKKYSIAELNNMTQTEFVTAIGAVFEHTPAIASATWMQRPFINLVELHQAMVTVMHQLSPVEQLALINAHPNLGSKAKMADASVKEQTQVGFDRLTPEEYERFLHLNQAYRAKFGFPLIIAVRHHTKASVLAAFDRRLLNSVETEQQQALAEIAEIARLRLLEQIIDPVT